MYENKNNNMKNFMIYSSSYLKYIIKHTLKGIILNETKMLMKKHSFRLGLEIYPKYSKHWPYYVAQTIDCVCRKLNHGLNHGVFLSLSKLIEL